MTRAHATAPAGAPFWWHLAEPEQRMFMELTDERQAALRRVKELEKERDQLRQVARTRCRHMDDHAHTLSGLVAIGAPIGSASPINR